MAKFIGNRPLPVAAQIGAMRRLWPDFAMQWKNGVVVWVGRLQPIDLSPEYTVEIRYRLGDQPHVSVLSPQLRDRPDQPIPHVYPGKKLCLYFPRAKEWTPAMPIAEAIIGWASDWLYFYEIWHATGEWLADGVHPNHKSKRASKDCGVRTDIPTRLEIPT